MGLDDQRFAEGYLLAGRDFPKGWRPLIMMQNVERFDPWEGVDEAAACRRLASIAGSPRSTKARRSGIGRARCAVLRVEVFADQDATEHRARWRSDAPGRPRGHVAGPVARA